MSIIRRQHTERYTVVPNAIMNDEQLTGDVLGLLVFLLSKPNDWQVSIASLAATGRFGGKNKLSRDLGTLRKAGYAGLRRFADGSTEWIIRDDPDPQNGDMEPHPQNPKEAFGDVLQSTEFHKVQSDTPTEDARAKEPVSAAEGSSNAEPAAKPPSIPDMPLPDCISREAWRDWCEYRAKGKERAKWTPLAATKAIALLARADAAGHDTAAIMERSIVGGWSGLFPDRETRKPGIVEARRPGPIGNTVRGNHDTAKPLWQRARDRKHELDEFMAAFERGEVDLDGAQVGQSDPQAYDGEFRVVVA